MLKRAKCAKSTIVWLDDGWPFCLEAQNGWNVENVKGKFVRLIGWILVDFTVDYIGRLECKTSSGVLTQYVKSVSCKVLRLVPDQTTSSFKSLLS